MSPAAGSGEAGYAAELRQALTRDEVARRLVHASGTALPALYVLDWATWPQVSLLFVVGAVVALGLESIRLVVGLNWTIYDRLTREYEQDNLAGYALYFISSAAVALAVAPMIAVPAILMLTIADPISGLLGSGELRPAKRTFVLLATFGVCLLLASPFVPFVPALFGAVAATVADGFKPVVAGYVIDDNLTIPPAAAGAMLVGFEVAAAL
jgi:dolichol kinase